MLARRIDVCRVLLRSADSARPRYPTLRQSHLGSIRYRQHDLCAACRFQRLHSMTW